MTLHVFVDNSNIFGGAQRTALVVEPAVPWQAIRLYYRNFFQLIEGGREATTRIMGGSVPPGNDLLWEHAQKGGYSTDLLKRVVNDEGRLSEQGVDEVMHLKIANVLLDFEPGTLVLATGDGAPSHFQTSFRDMAERALLRGWSVEVWSWKAQLSPRFRALSSAKGTLRVCELDASYLSITFVKGQTLVTPTGTFTVPERVVSKLPPQHR